MSKIRVSEIRGCEIRGSEIRGSEIRVSEIRGSEIRGSEIRVSEIRISSNHRELHGAIFCSQSINLPPNTDVLLHSVSAKQFTFNQQW